MDLALTVFTPALAAAVLLGAGQWGRPAWFAVIALSLGYAAGHLLIGGWPPFPAISAHDWLFWPALAAGVLAGVEGLLERRPVLRWTLRAILLLLAAYLLAAPMLELGRWSEAGGLLRIVSLGAGLLLLCASFEGQAAILPVHTLPAAAWLVATGTSLALLVAGSASDALRCAGLAAGLGPFVLLAFWRPEAVRHDRIAPLLALLLGGFWINGALWTELPLASVGWMALAPLLSWGAVRFDGWRATLLALLLTAMPLGLAVWLAVRAAPALDY